MAICFSNYQIELFSLCFTEQGINISKSQKRNASSLIRKVKCLLVQEHVKTRNLTIINLNQVKLRNSIERNEETRKLIDAAFY